MNESISNQLRESKLTFKYDNKEFSIFCLGISPFEQKVPFGMINIHTGDIVAETTIEYNEIITTKDSSTMLLKPKQILLNQYDKGKK